MFKFFNVLVVSFFLTTLSCDVDKSPENESGVSEPLVISSCCDSNDFYLCSARMLRWEISSLTNGWRRSFYSEITNDQLVDSIYGSSGLKFYGAILDSVISLHEEEAPLLAYRVEMILNGDSIIRAKNNEGMASCDVIKNIQKPTGKLPFFQNDLVDCFLMPDSTKYNLLVVSKENYSSNLEINLTMLLGLVDDCP